jgi:O-antigen ligase
LFEEKKFARLITILSSSLGVYAVILSGNRGTFLMLMIMSVIYLLIVFRRHFKGKTKEKIIISLSCILIIFSLSKLERVYKGLELAQENIKMWSSEGSSKTSSGMRLEMWSGSIEAFQQSPWLGHGYRNANNVVSNYVDPKIKEAISAFTHLHNEYITNLVSAGVIGLISVLILLFFPLVVFLKNYRKNSMSVHSIMGILLCISYIGIGMTHIAFGEEHVNAFYIFFLAILLPRVIKERNDSY